MKKTDVENFKEVTHEIEFMFCFRFNFANNNYMWKIERLYRFITSKYVYNPFFLLQITIII